MLNTGPGSVYAAVRDAPEWTATVRAKPRRVSIWKRLFGRRSEGKRTAGTSPSKTRDEVKVSIGEIDKLVFAILMHVTKPRGLPNDYDVDFFAARCDGCGFEFPSKDLSHLATRIAMRGMGALVVTPGGVDVYACPECECGTAAVLLRGMTDRELRMVRGEL
jgi:hypothetical protein